MRPGEYLSFFTPIEIGFPAIILDFPYIQYRDVLGEPISNCMPRYGRHWVSMLTDVPAGIQEIRAGMTTPVAYIRSLVGKTVYSVFDWRDPVPVVGALASAFAACEEDTKQVNSIVKRYGKHEPPRCH